MSKLTERLGALPPARLRGIRRGIEKESLRALPDGKLALTPHPSALGSALTHPHITTDFSESQLELITGVHASPEAALDELVQVHQHTYRVLAAAGDERMWVSSMPCGLPTDETIPIGRYGSSNVGRAKSVYRMGLSHRYGRRMQTISGIHYNWSLPEVSSEQYFALIRNFRRHAFLLLYLFGASPALCSTFVAGRPHTLQPLGNGTMYMPHGTSLRMGPLGYQSEAQASLAVSYNSLEGYGASLQDALTRPWPAYEAIGIQNLGGDYNQLATSLLQIENEFYGTIRPKRVIYPGEHNQHLTAARGREPGLQLQRNGREVALTAWGAELVAQCAPIAAALDATHGGSQYGDAVRAAALALEQPEGLPSARVLAAMAAEHDNSFVSFVRAQSAQARGALLDLPFSAEQSTRFDAMTQQSIEEQKRIEAADTLPFEIYREQYVSPARLGVGARGRLPVAA
ncbi:MAG: glutamate--cysteine ligase [Variovorax sp.]|nr:MAG: glutamate--cysteine ligase [Variovorax sp.]